MSGANTRDAAPMRPSTVGEQGRRVWLYPERRSGPRARRRLCIALALMAFYLVTPWLEVAGQPLLRFDLMLRRAFVFGAVFRISDANFIVFVLLFLALTLFLVTALRGRIWCGQACPQTVFTEWLIRPIEEFCEGGAHKRRRQDQGPMSFALAMRKSAKHLCFALVAVAVANTALAYFVAPATLLTWISSSPLAHPQGFGVMTALSLGFYLDLAWFREQFCAFVCPYARFQSILLDAQTPVVAYDAARGDPRGKGAGKGDCIDCGLCVRVCPTGIDIRNGLQLECIMCERCIDACDSIMTNLKRPRELIKVAAPVDERRGLRPRLWFYAAALTAVLLALAFRLADKQEVALTMLRAPGTAYVQLPDGRVSNLFTLRAASNEWSSTAMSLRLVAPGDAELICGPCSGELQPMGDAQFPVVVIFHPQAGAKLEAEIEHVASGQRLEVPLLQP